MDDIIAVYCISRMVEKEVLNTIMQLPTDIFRTKLSQDLINSIKNNSSVVFEDCVNSKIVSIRGSDKFKFFVSNNLDSKISEIKVLLNEFKSKELSKIINNFTVSSYKDISNLEHLTNNLLTSISSLPSLDNTVSAEEAANMMLSDVQNSLEKNQSIKIKTIYDKFNSSISGGFKRGDVSVIVGVSGEGKTTFVQNLCSGFNNSGFKVLYLTSEMREKDLLEKFSLIEGVKRKYNYVSESMFDRPSKKEFEVLLKIWEIVSKYNVEFLHCSNESKLTLALNRCYYDIVIVDHLHDYDGIEDNSIASKIMNTLKNYAVSKDSLVIALAQPRKTIATSHSSKPEMVKLGADDIKGSQAIQAKASQVIVLRRDLDSGNTYTEIVKNRWGQKGGITRFSYNRSVYEEK